MGRSCTSWLLRKLPVGKSVFPDVDFASVVEAFGFQAYTIRTLDELRALAPVLGRPEGPILVDCKVNADIAAPSWTSSPNSRPGTSRRRWFSV